MQKVTPCLWFDNQAEEAVSFYISVFKKGNIEKITYYGSEGFEIHHRPAGSVMTVSFTLDDQKYLALNGGPEFQFNEAISLIINCETQEEVDYFWAKLSEGGQERPCGWLKDKFGLSWQVVPTILEKLLSDPEKSEKIMKIFMQMKKIEIAKLMV